MIEIHPISPTYPIKKPNRIIRERERQADEQRSSDKKKEQENDDSISGPEQHIDEVV